MAFSGYVGYLYGPIGGLIGLIPQLEVTRVHADRFFEVRDLRPTVQDRSDLPDLDVVRGDIVLHGVGFAYEAPNLVLHDIDLSIPSGATVALVGRSGSGKSTLAKLIPRFYDPVEGTVSIDGRDIRQVRLQSLRRQIGFALQGSTIFQGSVLDNLCFGRDIPFSEVERAARTAYIHDFIASLPEAYQTQVGEGGAQLSEGQKQRVALARVLLLDTPILILDEPTAALDPESEYCIQEALQTVRQGRTTLIIAHRLSTIQSADEIVVLDEGRVAERGTHDSLLIEGGVYAELHDRMARI
jgi:ABC-type multidrug transport system fused ATPase/permease subunit